ncbi:hypothetical protein A9Z39_22625 [Paenibacillus polymyxa]|nr:hypothetical protein A9Z39_22625 [Paenibacillus polymyxa]
MPHEIRGFGARRSPCRVRNFGASAPTAPEKNKKTNKEKPPLTKNTFTFSPKIRGHRGRDAGTHVPAGFSISKVRGTTIPSGAKALLFTFEIFNINMIW